MREAEERAFKRLVKRAKLPGFRPGKVPRKIFEQTYGSHTISNEAMEDVVPAVYAKAVREHDLEPVDRPQMEVLPEEDGQPTRVKAVVEVRPHIDLGEYKGLEITRPAVEVTDADVDRTLASLARDRGTLVPAERPAQLGDIVTMDYEGKVDGVAFEGGTAKGQQTELDDNRFIAGFATGIAGMSAGETKDVEAHFPAEYQQTELAGKTAIFTVTVHEVKQLEVPPIDDEFAKAASQHENLEQLKSDIRERLQKVAEQRRRRDVGNDLVEQLVNAHDFPLPETMIERETESMLQDAAGMGARMGMSFEQYLEASGKTEESLRSELAPEAAKRVKATMLLEAIAKAENITASASDLQNELKSLAQQYGQPVERIRAALGNNVLSLMDSIVRTKTVEFLIENAKDAATPAG